MNEYFFQYYQMNILMNEIGPISGIKISLSAYSIGPSPNTSQAQGKPSQAEAEIALNWGVRLSVVTFLFLA